MLEDKHITVNSEEQLFDAISRLIDESRKQVAKAVNTAMVYTYYGVGQYIVEFEQGGKARAAYGKGVLIRLSARLKEKYGKGWSVETLTKCRKFYMVFSISSPLETKSNQYIISAPVVRKSHAYAQQYALCLPKKEELQQKLKEWISEYEESHDTSDSNE